MYRTVVKEITEGLDLDPFARFLLRAFSALFGVMIIMMAADSKDPFFACAIGIFCFAITILCVTWGRNGSLRVASSAWYCSA
jgi:hypothetical protein